MDGILNVHKPPGMTSHDVVAHIRKLTGIQRVGHTGTLDPGATGVLPVCLGKATRITEYLLDADKAYRAEITLGITTSTADNYGEVLRLQPAEELTESDLERAMQGFVGELLQIPPMVSAVKHEGNPLYRLARQGKEVPRKARRVTIYSLKLLRFWPGKYPRALFEVVCSKGTYVRALCSDIGDALGCGAHMSSLVRTRSGPFELDNALTLQQIEEAWHEGRLESLLLPIDAALRHMPQVVVPSSVVFKIVNGVQPLGYSDLGISGKGKKLNGGLVRLYSPEGEFLAIAEPGACSKGRPGHLAKCLWLRKVFAQGGSYANHPRP